MKLKDIFKNWKSTIVGIAMIGIAIHKYFTTGEIDYAEVAIGLTGVGFVFSKDADKSHTRE